MNKYRVFDLYSKSYGQLKSISYEENSVTYIVNKKEKTFPMKDVILEKASPVFTKDGQEIFENDVFIYGNVDTDDLFTNSFSPEEKISTGKYIVKEGMFEVGQKTVVGWFAEHVTSDKDLNVQIPLNEFILYEVELKGNIRKEQ